MNRSPFRQALWQAMAVQDKTQGQERATQVAQVLQEYGLIVRASPGWVKAQLAPVVSGVWERALGEQGTASLLLCEWLQSHLGFDIQGNGLLEGDGEAEAWFARLSRSEIHK